MLLRAAVVDEANLPYKLVKINLDKKENFLRFDFAKLPTATKSFLASGTACPTQKLKFKQPCSTMFKKIVLKRQEIPPLKYILVRSPSSLNPKNMVSNKAGSIKIFTRVIDKLYKKKHLSSIESDNTKLQYKEFIDDVVVGKISLILTWPTIA